jgi:hypothetical protein
MLGEALNALLFSPNYHSLYSSHNHATEKALGTWETSGGYPGWSLAVFTNFFIVFLSLSMQRLV